MKKIATLLMATCFIFGACQKSDDSTDPEEERNDGKTTPTYTSTYTFNNQSTSLIKVMCLNAWSTFPKEGMNSVIFTNKLDLKSRGVFNVVVDGVEHPLKVYKGCQMWAKIYILVKVDDNKYYESVWLTKKQLITESKSTHTVTFNYPQDTSKAIFVSRAIKKEVNIPLPTEF